MKEQIEDKEDRVWLTIFEIGVIAVGASMIVGAVSHIYRRFSGPRLPNMLVIDASELVRKMKAGKEKPGPKK